jgi:hypothetical protein
MEIKALAKLTSRKGEVDTAVEDARRALALSLKAAGREDALAAVNSALDKVVAGALLMFSGNASDRPSGSVERRSGPCRGNGVRAAPIQAGEALSDTMH